MARHNRDGRGSDQRGYDYEISFQPDWLNLIKVTRTLESGRQSTKTLFRNPETRKVRPGAKMRTRVQSPEQKLDFEIVVNDPRRVVRRVIIETRPAAAAAEEGGVIFSIEESGSSSAAARS
ncbi:MAG: hypothetical protein HY703_08020 [Gemmatimonadetes bacterium]|nr:hypothetical protein [Gemmatimonadota bacterium]